MASEWKEVPGADPPLTMPLGPSVAQRVQPNAALHEGPHEEPPLEASGPSTRKSDRCPAWQMLVLTNLPRLLLQGVSDGLGRDRCGRTEDLGGPPDSLVGYRAHPLRLDSRGRRLVKDVELLDSRGAEDADGRGRPRTDALPTELLATSDGLQATCGLHQA